MNAQDTTNGPASTNEPEERSANTNEAQHSGSARPVSATGAQVKRTIFGQIEERAGYVLAALGAARRNGSSRITPDIDLRESEGHYHIVSELPGLETSDIDLTLEGIVLTIDAQKQMERNEKSEQHLVSEIRSGTIHRSVTLPGPVGTASAKYENGVLEVDLEKLAAPLRKIKVSGT